MCLCMFVCACGCVHVGVGVNVCVYVFPGVCVGGCIGGCMGECVCLYVCTFGIRLLCIIASTVCIDMPLIHAPSGDDPMCPRLVCLGDDHVQAVAGPCEGEGESGGRRRTLGHCLCKN